MNPSPLLPAHSTKARYRARTVVAALLVGSMVAPSPVLAATKPAVKQAAKSKKPTSVTAKTTATPTTSLASFTPPPRSIPVSALSSAAASATVSARRKTNNPNALAGALRDLGLAYIAEKRPSDAAAPLREAVSISTTTGDKRGLAEGLQVLGWALSLSGASAQAVPLLERLVTMRTELLDAGAGSLPELSQGLLLLASAYREAANPSSADKVLTRLLALMTRPIPGVDRTEVLEAMGLARMQDKRPADAVGPLAEAASLRSAGAPSIAQADGLQLLGWAYAEAKRDSDSVPALQRSLAIRDQLDPGGRGTVETLQLLANAARTPQLATVRLDTLRRLVSIARTSTRPDLADTLDELGLSLILLRQERDAVAPLTEAVALRRKRPQRDLLATSLHNLGWALSAQQPTDAIVALNEAVGIRREIGSPDLQQSQDFLGYAMWSAKQNADAVPVFESSLALARKTTVSLTIAQSLNNLSLAYCLVARYADAIAPATEAVTRWSADPTRIGELGLAQHTLGWALLSIGRARDAVAPLQAALDLRTRANDPGASDSRDLLAVATQQSQQ